MDFITDFINKIKLQDMELPVNGNGNGNGNRYKIRLPQDGVCQLYESPVCTTLHFIIYSVIKHDKTVGWSEIVEYYEELGITFTFNSWKLVKMKFDYKWPYSIVKDLDKEKNYYNVCNKSIYDLTNPLIIEVIEEIYKNLQNNNTKYYHIFDYFMKNEVSDIDMSFIVDTIKCFMNPFPGGTITKSAKFK
jgi:hypothetical protein